MKDTPWKPGECPHCGGSGQLIRTEPRKPYIRVGDRLYPNAVPGAKPRTCQFCNGTGKDESYSKEEKQ